MSSARQKREFKSAFEAFSKTVEGKKQIDSINKQFENIDFGKVFHDFFAYYEEISPEQAINELEDLYYDLSLENAANPIWKLKKHLEFIPIAIEHQKKRKAKLENSGNNKNIAPQFIETPLKKLFNDAAKYDVIMQLMINEGAIIKTSNGLKWHGYKGNAKYEAIGFVEALSANGLLNKKASDYSTVDILSNTFLNFTYCDKTARNKKINTVARPKYEALLNSIK